MSEGWGVKTGGNNKTYTIVGDGSTTQFDIELPFNNTNILVDAWKKFDDFGLVALDVTRPSSLADNYIRIVFTPFSIPQVGEDYNVVINNVS